MTDALSTPTTQPPAAETRLRAIEQAACRVLDAIDTCRNSHTEEHQVTAGAELDEATENMRASLTQPEPTAQHGSEEVEAWICDGLPDAMIEAGCGAWDKARIEMQDREASDQPEAYTDWDDGMIVAAIYKAMAPFAALSAQQGGGEEGNDYPACPVCGAPAGMDCRTVQGRIPPHPERVSAQQAAGEAVAWRRMNPQGTASTGVTDTEFYRDLWLKEGSDVRPLYAAPQPEAPAEVQQGVAWLYTKPKCFNIIRYQGERGLHVPEGFTETPLFATPQQGQEVEAEVVATCERLAARMGGRYVLRANDASDPQSAAAPADRDILHLARILEEWDMKPWPNDHTGHSYEDIARDALTRLALPAAASVEAGERAQIVGWLRGEAEMRDRLADDHPTIDGVRYNKNRAIALHMAVEAIERGDHVAAKGKDQA